MQGRFDRGVSGTADLYIEETQADRARKERARIEDLKRQEVHIENAIKELHRITGRRRPKEIPQYGLKETAKKVLIELSKINNAVSELRDGPLVKDATKFVQEFIEYYAYWEFIWDKGTLPGFLKNKVVVKRGRGAVTKTKTIKVDTKYNNKTIEDVLKDIAKHLRRSVHELMELLKEAHKRYQSMHVKFLK